MKTAQHRRRNPGPGWGFGAIAFWGRVLPAPILRAVLAVSAWIALRCMSRARAHSRDYHRALFGREPSRREIYRHFLAFTRYLVVKVCAGDGHPPRFRWAPDVPAATRELLASDPRPLLLGSFHVGYSDLLGFYLGDLGRRAAMVRLRVDNSGDIDALARNQADSVRVVWVDEPFKLMLTLKEVIEGGESLAIQCDRIEHASKTAPFHFLGQTRPFPVTIYRLSRLFRLPVLFCIGLPDPGDRHGVLIHASPIFQPGDDDPNAHFQAVLTDLEARLRTQPEQWFNFCPLN